MIIHLRVSRTCMYVFMKNLAKHMYQYSLVEKKKKKKRKKKKQGPYIPHLNHVIHSIVNRDAVLKVMVTLTMNFALRVIFWSEETSLQCLRVLVPSIA